MNFLKYKMLLKITAKKIKIDLKKQMNKKQKVQKRKYCEEIC